MDIPIIQTTTIKVLDEINSMLNSTEIILNDMFEFEKMIMQTDTLEEIQLYVTKNENVIYDKILLCNNYYKKKFKVHPMTCHRGICYKTPVYYALWLNCYYYQTMFEKIKILATLSTDEIISEFLKFIYSLECVCHLTRTYKDNYDHNDMNFLKVNLFLNKMIPNLFVAYENFKSNVTKKNNNDKIIKLECVSCANKIEKKDFINNEINNHNKIGDLICEIKYYWEKYSLNCEITKYLFSVQSYEYYIIHLNYKQFELEQSLDKILLNKFTDLNFYKSPNENLLYCTMKKDCKQEIITKIINNGGKLPHNKNLESMFKNNECKIENIKVFLTHYDGKYFSNESLLTILKQNLMRSHKIDIVNIFSSRGLLTNAIKILLESEESYNILQNLYESDDVVVSKITIDDMLFCMNMEKIREFELILKNNVSYANEICNDTTLIMIAIKENKIKFLKILLQNGGDPFLSHNNISPIMMTILENRLDMLEYLLQNWIKKCSISENTSHIMLAIREGNIEVLKLLLKYNADPFSSIDGTTPTLYAIENDRLTSLECLLIYGNNIDKENNPIANLPYNETSPLMASINKSKLVSFELLLKYGANPFEYINGLNILHYAIIKNKYEFVALVKDYKKDTRYVLNEITRDDRKMHSIFLAIDSYDPIKCTDMLLQNQSLNYEYKLSNGSNILNYIIRSKNKLKTKISLFKRYINRNIDLKNEVDNTPLIIYATEHNMFDIVVMIINKLIETEEIKIMGYTKNDNDIINILARSNNKKIQLKSEINYCSLVLIYLKNGKTEYVEEFEDDPFKVNTNILIYGIAYILILTLLRFYQMQTINMSIDEIRKNFKIYYEIIFLENSFNTKIKKNKIIKNDIYYEDIPGQLTLLET